MEPISLQDLENSARLQTAKTNTDKDMEIEHTGEIKTLSFLHCAPYLIQFFNNARQGLQKAWKVLHFIFQQFSLSKCELNKILKRYYESNSVFNYVIFLPQINLLTSLHHLTEHELHIFSFHEQFAWLLTWQDKNEFSLHAWFLGPRPSRIKNFHFKRSIWYTCYSLHVNWLTRQY